MPGLVQSYDVLLDFTNDTHDFTSLQLLRDYNNRNGSTAGAVLIPPGETVTLVLDAGSVYKYVLKTCTKVASVTYVSGFPPPLPNARPSPGTCILAARRLFHFRARKQTDAFPSFPGLV